MASATSNSSSTAARKAAPKAKRQTEASKASARRLRAATTKPRLLFIPGSLNDSISKLKVGESLGHVLRIPVEPTGRTLSAQAQAFFKAKNSVLSGGIAKVRSAAEHKSKRFTMERGQYMTASNDALFAFLTVTRVE